jgi:multiple sugar transport system substrate-binding protein/sn-glycerol 3-phosphate transport system substrate-binding protein
VQLFSGPDQALKRYLTLFYGITLGLALILAILAISLPVNRTADPAAITQTALPNTTFIPQSTAEIHRLNKPTSVPAIPPTPNEETPSPLGVTSADLREAQVRLWQPWTGKTGDVLQAMVDEFNRTNQWGIHVSVSSFEGFGRLDEEMESAIISGTLPDVLIDYGYQAQNWNGNSILTDLTPYVNDPVWGFSSGELSDFIPGFWAEDVMKNASSGGSVRLGIPFYRSAYVLFYNQSWARELGYSNPPTTPYEFTDQACAAAKAWTAQGGKTDQNKGGWLITPQPGALAGWIYAFGGGITNPSGEGYLFDTPQTSQAFQTIKDMVERGCAWSEAGLDPQVEFATRQALFVVGSLFDIPAQQEAFLQAGSKDTWAAIPFPSRSQAAVDTYGPSLLITKSTPARQLAAWLVTEWLVYPPNQTEWVSTFEVYPTRQSTLSYLDENSNQNPQWTQALSLLPVAHGEPSLASWSVTRWVLNDAMTQLIDPKVSSDQIPAILENLDAVAAEINSQVR